jgi:tRNA(fMet)-specific endonuclease VapC
MTYLLVSNACISIINKKVTDPFQAALNRALRLSDALFVPTIVVHELWFGVAKSHRVRVNTYNLTQFLKHPFQVLDFDKRDASVAGEIRADLARRGTPIGPYDVLERFRFKCLHNHTRRRSSSIRLV